MLAANRTSDQPSLRSLCKHPLLSATGMRCPRGERSERRALSARAHSSSRVVTSGSAVLSIFMISGSQDISPFCRSSLRFSRMLSRMVCTLHKQPHAYLCDCGQILIVSGPPLSSVSTLGGTPE
ncbi:hypothetical protein PENSPDRAFT_346172 [Peniophora sp. CONT]|nr:hypothetical protein PENSPDRAFT_346172 [Peniophora sp. CONT]